MDEKTDCRIAVLIERSRAYGRRLCEGVQAGVSVPAEVAAQSGFRSLAYFSNCFTAAFGTPPSRYREN